MKPHHFQHVLGALDRTLETFDQAGPNFSTEDLQLRLRIAKIRSDVLKAESGHPFEFDPFLPVPADSADDPDVTRTPWAQAFVSNRVQLPPRSAP